MPYGGIERFIEVVLNAIEELKMISALNDIKNEYFKDVIIYSISEPSAMGCVGSVSGNTGELF